MCTIDNNKMDPTETGCGLDSSGSELGPAVNSCSEHGNGPSGSMKGGEFFYVCNW